MSSGEKSGPGGTVVVDAPTEPAPAPGGTVPLDSATTTLPSNEPEAVSTEEPARYVSSAPLGEGGMGVVWSVFDRHLKRTVAFKQLRVPGALGSVGASSSKTPAGQRFLREARVTGSLAHPAIPPVYELGQRADGSLYYTMRIVSGRTLQDALAGAELDRRLGLIPSYLALVSAVAHAHRHSVIHRDLKPANVMLGDFGETVVLDWGLAKVKGESDEQGAALASELRALRASSTLETMAGSAMGTPSYMPPEQARGAVDEIDERSDVYALGAILYELLAGRPPHVGRSGLEIVQKVLKEPIAPVLELEPRAPKELAAIAKRALEHERSDRYPDAAALARDVQAYLTGELVHAHRYGVRERAVRWLRRHRWALGAVVALAALLVLALAYRREARRDAREAAEKARVERVLARVDAILADSASAENDRVSIDNRAFQLVSLREPATQARVLDALRHPNAAVRRVAARALGVTKDPAAVGPLAERLAEGAESDEDVVIELIVALGLIGDARAEAPVAAARKRHGSNGTVWKHTETAYRMIPLPAMPDGGSASAEDWTTRGLAHLNKRDPRSALEHFDKAIALDPKLAKAHNNRAIARRRLGDETGALVDFEKALELDPNSVQARYNVALVKRSLGQNRSALEDFDRLVQGGQLGAQVSRARAATRGLLGDLPGALSDLGEARRLEPKNPLNETAEADLWLEREEWDKAIASTYRALELNPAHVFALVQRATARRHKGDVAGALGDYDRALGIEPTDPDARAGRAHALIGKGDGAAAGVDAEALVRADPKNPMLWMMRAVYFHAARGDLGKAESDLEEAVKRAGNTTKGIEYGIYAAFVGARLETPRGKLAVERLAPDDGPHFSMRAGRLLKGRAELDELSNAASTRRDRCLIALAGGLAAELAGDRARARARYDEGTKASRLDESPCILVRIGAETLGGK